MVNVDASVTDGSTENYGVYNSSSTPSMTNVTARATGGGTNYYGVFNTSSSPTMVNVSAEASGGGTNYAVYNTSLSSPSIRGSSLSGVDSIYTSADSSARVSDTMLSVSATGPGTLTCVDVFGPNFAAAANCEVPVIIS